ncbi:UDP-2,3-diacylglucosamine diphosphatase [Chitinimonas sp. BJB300]|uniref:UDP-2,3-diacylglucosamine diphosphatase n=1 Tax=Chitinimonas sp. BJB300 TaxID=1559339 RepID=UPI000C0F65C2|nr:UDP-2,3-diacylglucosamine diphosphatase [Chitinimonas sp. BJB300]PHV09929.1 UDP-2,3-diacylglucosamine diphosphatase [Chitinimonas sp. BJB300]TSJ89671.1 UDP-2,3-diacylglucosamine diphosphatase [Chitinimonas sp. BJB300]
MPKPILFASDLHLSDADPATTAAFLAFLHTQVQTASALYLLGDIFEYWIGDDDQNALNGQIAGELRALAKNGVSIFLMHGNRDFLLGPQYAAAAGATLLDDPFILNAFGHKLILSHGDVLCTDDTAYQQFRATVRQPAWQRTFLARPLAERRAEVERIRAASELAKKDKASDIMDVNPHSVANLFVQHTGADLIHGHTHRPARHQHDLAQGTRQRWVLPDWYGGEGGYLQLDETGLSFVGINTNATWR